VLKIRDKMFIVTMKKMGFDISRLVNSILGVKESDDYRQYGVVDFFEDFNLDIALKLKKKVEEEVFASGDSKAIDLIEKKAFESVVEELYKKATEDENKSLGHIMGKINYQKVANEDIEKMTEDKGVKIEVRIDNPISYPFYNKYDKDSEYAKIIFEIYEIAIQDPDIGYFKMTNVGQRTYVKMGDIEGSETEAKIMYESDETRVSRSPKPSYENLTIEVGKNSENQNHFKFANGSIRDSVREGEITMY
jgi:hypothetical protein